jgi:protein transport protein SEC24
VRPPRCDRHVSTRRADRTPTFATGIISELTGGETFYLPRFDPVRDAARLQSSLRKVLHQPSVWNATLRIRCSTGLRVARHVGSFFERSPTDVDLPAVPPTASLLALLAHSGSPLTEREPASIQVAILHTTRTGERRVRVLNLRLGVTSLIGNVFRYADPDAVVGILTKEGMGRMESKTLPEVRDDLQRRAVKILTSYRRNCALGAPLGQVRQCSYQCLTLTVLGRG